MYWFLESLGYTDWGTDLCTVGLQKKLFNKSCFISSIVMRIYYIVCEMILLHTQISYFGYHIPNGLLYLIYAIGLNLIKIDSDLPERAKPSNNIPISYQTNYYWFEKTHIFTCQSEKKQFINFVNCYYQNVLSSKTTITAFLISIRKRNVLD